MKLSKDLEKRIKQTIKHGAGSSLSISGNGSTL